VRRGTPECDHTSHLSEFRIDPEDEDRAHSGSERIIMKVGRMGLARAGPLPGCAAAPMLHALEHATMLGCAMLRF
jgi:hypothetical protein